MYRRPSCQESRKVNVAIAGIKNRNVEVSLQASVLLDQIIPAPRVGDPTASKDPSLLIMSTAVDNVHSPLLYLTSFSSQTPI
jgi:hypothetical protein